jgi:hypothetical protein
MTNRSFYFRDPTTVELLNNGVSKVSEIGQDAAQIKTLRFELQNFVCDGEYARGMERILSAYLGGLGKPEQSAVWVSGFFGSGKSHLVKVLRYLWEDYRFDDGATARSLVTLPPEVSAMLTELSNRAKPLGGLRAAAGTLGAGSMDNVRLAFIQLILRAAGLPENLAQARFILWLRASGLETKVQAALQQANRSLAKEVLSLKLSIPLAEALVAADPKYATPANAQAAIRDEFKENNSPTVDDALKIVKQIFGQGEEMPCTLLVVDEIQQFVSEKINRAHDVQEIAEHICTDLKSRLLLVGTGQAALHSATPALQRLQARFVVKVQLSDTDVESVIRKTVLRKKPEHETTLAQCMSSNQGELARHLQGTRLAATHTDEAFFVADYPLLPTRRRFWEKVLRNTDHSGTRAQLRSQLQIVFEATRQTADMPVGSVVPADFIYDQISTDLLNSGELEREYDEIIRKQRDGSPEGDLRSSLCALVFLIGKLPRTPGADDGVRASAETLVDLLVSDLKADRPRLELQVPKHLEQLVEKGQLMAVETEYRLQTREGAVWTHEFNRRRTIALNDDQRISTERAELLRDAARKALKPVSSLQQGKSGTSRKLVSELSSARPVRGNDDVTLWLREGWSDDEKSVLNDARAAGVNSPMLFGYLPRMHHEELKQAIASQIAAQETLDAHGMTGGPETIEPRKAVETHLAVAQHRIQELLGQVIGGAKVFLGGGQEANGIELADKVQDAADSAMVRLFPQFSEADHANWGQVVAKARGGYVGALAQVGLQGNPTQHPVCRRVLDFIGAGKKGKDLRDNFKGAPYGWPQDAIDGALYVMLVAGNLRATVNGQPTNASLPQNQLGPASFYVDVPPLDVQQRLNLKALFQKAGITTQNGKESEAAAQALAKLLTLAATAGGGSPRPEEPDTQAVTALQMLSGNAQLLKIHEQKDDLAAKMASWKKSGEAITKRWPAWERLQEFQRFATGLPEAEGTAVSIAAIVTRRSLLADPDPIPELIKQLAPALRAALGRLQNDLAAAFSAGEAKLAASAVWAGRTEEQRAAISASCQLTPPPKAAIGTDDEILEALRNRSLADRRNLLDAVPQRFARALEEAGKLATPDAVRLTLPAAVIETDAELDQWLAGVRQQVQAQLQKGPVIL